MKYSMENGETADMSFHWKVSDALQISTTHSLRFLIWTCENKSEKLELERLGQNCLILGLPERSLISIEKYE